MAMTANIFIGADETPIVESKVYEGPTPFATFKLGTGDSNVTAFFYSLDVIEKMQLELASLARELRDEHGWESDQEYAHHYGSDRDAFAFDNFASGMDEPPF